MHKLSDADEIGGVAGLGDAEVDIASCATLAGVASAPCACGVGRVSAGMEGICLTRGSTATPRSSVVYTTRNSLQSDALQLFSPSRRLFTAEASDSASAAARRRPATMCASLRRSP